jgi:putative restriction endonuclease
MTARNGWRREEMLVCLAFYSSLEKSQRRVPPPHIVSELVKLTKRTQGSIKLRFANFNSVDPLFTDAGLKSLDGGGKHVKEIWNEYSKNDGTLDSAKILRYLAAAHFETQNDLSNS